MKRMQKNMKPKGTIFCHVMASIPMNFFVGAPAAAAATTVDAAGLKTGLLDSLHTGLLTLCRRGALACTAM